MPRPALLVALLLTLACGGGTSGPTPPPAPPPAPPPPPPPPAPASITIVAGNQVAAAAGTALTVEPTVVVRDAANQPIAGATVQFTVTSGDGWVADATVTTGANGLATTAWYLGPAPGATQALSAQAATQSVGFTATATPLVSGTTYLGRNGYIEFIAGDGTLILSAPHGGALVPAEIPDRTVGTTVTDTNTDPLVRAMAAAILSQSGKRPHLIIVRLRRTKLDGNREIIEAAAGNPAAIRAWREYHGFIEAAAVAATAAGPRPLFLDVHGHGHTEQRLEWGYLLTAADLARSDAELNAGGFALLSSIRMLWPASGVTFANLLRGPASLGARFEVEGYPSVPSPSKPSPGADPYFNGGYSTARHASGNDGRVGAVQLESYFVGVRDTDVSRQAFAAAAARVLVGWP